MKNKIIMAVKIIFALGLLTWLVYGGKIDFEALKKVGQRTDILVGIVLLSTFNIFIAAERWRILLKAQVAKYPRWQILRLTFMGLFFNFFMPGGVGGDVVKGFYLVKDNAHQRTKAIVSLLMDRLIGLYVMICAAVLVMLFDLNHVMTTEKLDLIFKSMTSAWVIASLAFVIAWSKRLRKKAHSIIGKFKDNSLGKFIHTLFDAIASYGDHRTALFKAAMVSVVSQVPSILIFYQVGVALGNESMTLANYFIVVPVGFIVMALPITPGGVGVGQAAFFVLFNLYSQESGIVGTTSITIQQIMQLGFGLIGAYYFVRAKSLLKHATSTEPIPT